MTMAGSRKNPERKVEWSQERYEKAFNEIIINASLLYAAPPPPPCPGRGGGALVKNINDGLIKGVSFITMTMVEKDTKFEVVASIGKSINNVLYALNEQVAKLLFSYTG